VLVASDAEVTKVVLGGLYAREDDVGPQVRLGELVLPLATFGLRAVVLAGQVHCRQPVGRDQLAPGSVLADP
jgi:hypothetical protein